MPEQAKNYDDVKQYRLDPERERELLKTAGACTHIWANRAGHSMAGGKTVIY